MANSLPVQEISSGNLFPSGFQWLTLLLYNLECMQCINKSLQDTEPIPLHFPISTGRLLLMLRLIAREFPSVCLASPCLASHTRPAGAEEPPAQRTPRRRGQGTSSPPLLREVAVDILVVLMVGPVGTLPGVLTSGSFSGSMFKVLSRNSRMEFTEDFKHVSNDRAPSCCFMTIYGNIYSLVIQRYTLDFLQ